MHIPEEMLTGAVVPVTAVISAAGILGAVYGAQRSQNHPGVLKFAAVTALIFAGQMLNFPIDPGISGHMIGAVLAGSLLGVPFGILSLAVVVILQTVVFTDGGLLALGANILNMALVASVPLILLSLLKKFSSKEESVSLRGLKIFAAAWLSVPLAALACGLELTLSGHAQPGLWPVLLGVHGLIGVGEALITVLLVLALEGTPERKRGNVPLILFFALAFAVVLSPLASSAPDGLEWVAERYVEYKSSAPLFVTPWADYALSGLENPYWSTALAGLFGVAISLLSGLGVGGLTRRRTLGAVHG